MLNLLRAVPIKEYIVEACRFVKDNPEYKHLVFVRRPETGKFMYDWFVYQGYKTGFITRENFKNISKPDRDYDVTVLATQAIFTGIKLPEAAICSASVLTEPEAIQLKGKAKKFFSYVEINHVLYKAH